MKKTKLLLDLEKPYTEEAKLLTDAINWLDRQRDVKALRICTITHRGYTDIFVCVRGKFVILELKDDTGTMSIHQEEFIKDMLEVGAIGGECRTLKQVIDYINAARMEA